MKTFRQIISSLSLGVFIASFLILHFPMQAHALKANEEAQYDYDAAVAAQILLACTTNTTIDERDYGKAKWGDGGRKYQVSLLWSGATNTVVDGEIDCNTPQDMGVIVKTFGFKDINEYNHFVAPSCNGDGDCAFRNDWKQAVFDKAAENKGRPGPDNTMTSVSKAGQYYFWSRVFRDGRCDGNVYTDQATYDAKPKDQRVDGPIYWVENNAVVAKVGGGFKKLTNNEAYIDLGPDYFDESNIRTMITQKAPLDINLVWYSDANGDNKYTCTDIANKLKDRSLADAFVALYAEKVAAANAPGATAQQIADGSGGGAIEYSNVLPTDDAAAEGQSCSEQMKSASGWIVCSILEIISKGVDTVMTIVDSMLNVDAQALYGDASLHQVWSYFRAVATFLLVGVGLVMVISQALGGGS